MKSLAYQLKNGYLAGKKYKAKGEFDLFKRIARERAIHHNGICYVIARDVLPCGTETTKAINLEDLQPVNFSHKLGKGMNPELRLEPSNIEIVSFGFHYWQHNKHFLQGTRQN